MILASLLKLLPRALFLYIFLFLSCPQLFSGGTDPQCREPLWTSKYATDGAMYQHLATVNAARTKVGISIS
jgi:hypothetical protein